ncbi:MAG: HigA family addiction module antitoxin [Spirochaetaceae bacterium]|nr:HigA family addiction module antitoxin [Spirochaetaceae bacterium]
MTIDDGREVYSDLAIPPGETLADEIAARGMTQTELAARLGRPVQVVNEIIRAKKAITDDTALGLEKVLGIPAAFWVNLEQNYRMTRARLREREHLQAEEEWLQELPVKEMEKRGWIAVGRNAQEKVRALLQFFGVANVAAYRKTTEVLGFRISDNARLSPGALAAWLRKGELEAQEIETRPFDSSVLLEAAHEARAMTEDPPQVFAPRMTQLFADAGVAFVVIPELPKTGANGVARWLTDRKAMIQLNLRYKWQDIFWFTLFHEVCHVLKHHTKRLIIDGTDKNGPIEDEANQWAADFLVPPDAWSDFRRSTPFNRTRITAFARMIGISPGIVVGRLQRERRLKYSEMVDLKGRFEWIND